MRRATRYYTESGRKRVISIHALHEESDQCHSGLHLVVGISIHARHEESDVGAAIRHGLQRISIHALHEESDG